MAIYRLSLKHGSRGRKNSAKAHVQYILRESKYDYKSHEVKAFDSGNIPDWAKTPSDFWQAADELEAANARLYSELEIALPRELTTEQQVSLIEGFVSQHIGKDHPYTWALHEAKSTDGSTNPHIHLMFTTRSLADGIYRRREVFFKRANGFKPENGGAPKERNWIKQETLIDLRKSWEQLANQALAKANHTATIDHRSLKEQGIDRQPHPKLAPYETMLWKQGFITENVEAILLLRELASIERVQACQQEHLDRLQEIENLRISEAEIGEYLAEQQKLLESTLRESEIVDRKISRLGDELKVAPASREDAFEMAKDRIFERSLESHLDTIANLAAKRNELVSTLEENGIGEAVRNISDIKELFQSQFNLREAKRSYNELLEEMGTFERRRQCEKFADRLYEAKTIAEEERNFLLDEALSIREEVKFYEGLIAKTEEMLANIRSEVKEIAEGLPPGLKALATEDENIEIGQETLLEQNLESQNQQRDLKLQQSMKHTLGGE